MDNITERLLKLDAHLRNKGYYESHKLQDEWVIKELAEIEHQLRIQGVSKTDPRYWVYDDQLSILQFGPKEIKKQYSISLSNLKSMSDPEEVRQIYDSLEDKVIKDKRTEKLERKFRKLEEQGRLMMKSDRNRNQDDEET